MKSFCCILPLIFLFSFCSVREPWKKLELNTIGGYYASTSELNEPDPYEAPGVYGAHNLFDGDPSTAWVEGVDGEGISESVTLAIGKEPGDYIYITNGYQKSRSLFDRNNRVKKLRLSLSVGFMIPGDETELYAYFYTLPFGEPVDVELEDSWGIQQIPMPWDKADAKMFMEKQLARFLKEFRSDIEKYQELSGETGTAPMARFFLTCEILEVFRGSLYDDTCISDIGTGPGIEKVMTEIPEEERITDIIKDDDQGIVYVVLDNNERMVLADENILAEQEDLPEGVFLYLEIMEISPDKEWVQIDYMYRQEVEARIEEIAHLYNARLRMHIGRELLGDTFGMYGFQEKDGRIFLDTDYGLVDLDEVAAQLEPDRP